MCRIHIYIHIYRYIYTHLYMCVGIQGSNWTSMFHISRITKVQGTFVLFCIPFPNGNHWLNLAIAGVRRIFIIKSKCVVAVYVGICVSSHFNEEERNRLWTWNKWNFLKLVISKFSVFFFIQQTTSSYNQLPLKSKGNEEESF